MHWLQQSWCRNEKTCQSDEKSSTLLIWKHPDRKSDLQPASKRGKLSAGDMEDIGYLGRDYVYVPR